MGGFIKDSSSDSYVLLGGGGHSELKTINGNSLFGSGNIVITSSSGGGDGNTLYYLTLNNAVNGHSSGTNLGTLFAPTAGGTAGQYLKSNGATSAPTWVNFPGITSHQTVSGTFWGNSWSNGGSLSGKITVAADNWAGLLLLNRTNNGSNWGASIAFQGSGSNRGAIHMEGNELYVGDVSGTFRYKVLTENNWNSTISVTGGDGDTKYYLTLNGTNKGHTSGTSLGSFYAPTSAGTSGQYLKSNGSGAPTWATFDFASSGHSHTLKIETTSDNSSINLAASTKYKLTAGGSTYVFKTPAAGSASGAYLPLAGGTMTGTIIVSDGNSASGQNDDIAAIRPIADNWHTIGSSDYHFCEGYINTIYSETVNATSFYGRLYGLATKANYLTGYSSAYTDPGLGAYSLSYYSTNSSTTSASTNGIANPTGGDWYYHLLMIHQDSSGYFCDVAWRLNDLTDPSMYFRIRKTSSYTGWVKVLTSENYTDYISSSSGGTSVYQYHNQSMSSNTNYRILTSTRTSNGTLENVYSKSACYMNDNGVYFTSDKKMKKDIRMFSLETNIMDCYNPVRRFSWKSNDMPSIGFISQEVEEWCPEAVGISDDGLKTVNYDVALSALCGAMFNRIKELEQTVKELQYQININKR